MKKLPEFCIKQGGVGSQSGLNSDPVSEFWGNGGPGVPGFGRLPTPEKGDFLMRVSDDNSLNFECVNEWPNKIFFRPGKFCKNFLRCKKIYRFRKYFRKFYDAQRAKRLIGFCATHLPV